jgi:plasmid maintenance system antidote protein VapI
MSNDIRQQLEEAWPGEWVLSGTTYAKMQLRDRVHASLWLGGLTKQVWHGNIKMESKRRVMPIPTSSVEADTLTEAARALRARAEILVDALERMEGLDDEPDAYEYDPDYASHPSEHLREWCEESGCRLTEVAPGRVRLTVFAVLGGHDVGQTEAAHLEHGTGVDASFWINLQRRYDEVHGE